LIFLFYLFFGGITMVKLWKKKYELNKEIEKFTVGNDYILDQKLVYYDCVASIAHAKMLKKVGLITSSEESALVHGLKEILASVKSGSFLITIEDEDCHTAIENYLTKKLGSIGKKIHTARSRNDQVLVNLHLYKKKELLDIKSLVLDFIETLLQEAKKHEYTPMPGYTHMQKAMPSSIGLWLASYAESLVDTLKLLDVVAELNNQSPLGSAAGYGTAFSIDREYTATLLGFGKVKNNVLYAQNSRAKDDALLITSLGIVMQDISKLATDLLLFSTKEFGFLSLPDDFCTGSSIMPQKKNPDVLELLRAKASVIEAKYIEIVSIGSKLPSGYNRDFQLLKEPVAEAIDITKDCLKIINLCIKNTIIHPEKLIQSLTPELFATDEVNDLVKKGVPFRDAYQQVSANLESCITKNAIENIKSKKHAGAPGNLGLVKLSKTINGLLLQHKKETKKFVTCIANLVN
jgi:argininosuccinate lyase